MHTSLAGADTTESVRSLYEKFPYPPPFESTSYLDGIRRGTLGVPFGPAEAFYTYFPERLPTSDLDVLIVGCGTTQAPALAASLPLARVTAIDLSEASLGISAAACAEAGLKNVEHLALPLQDIETLGRDFDLIVATGVLHHLHDPAAGLRTLSRVLRPEGSLAAMVYGTYGRTGVYMIQELARTLGLKPSERDAALLQAMLPHLPASHPIQLMGLGLHRPYPLAEVADMLLHPQDTSFTVDGVRALCEQAGLRFHRWIGQSAYHPEATPWVEAALGERLAALGPWERARAMELFHGDLHQHCFVLTHSARSTPEELFAGNEMRNAVPVLHKQLDIQREGAELVIRNRAVWRQPKVRGELGALSSVLRSIDGRSTVEELLHRSMGADLDDATMERARWVFWRLYRCDVIDLGMGC